MKRIFITIEYDGTNYKGWQQQRDLPSVQQTLTEALSAVCGHNVVVHASGRTDDGVHAIAQTAHFDTNCTVPPDRFAVATNIKLPDDIKITSSRQVAPDFHSRFSAKRKTYIYRIYTGKNTSPLKRLYFAHVQYPLNVELMQQACALFEGTHDFAAFKASDCKVKNTVRTIYSCTAQKTVEGVDITVCGNGFLQHMIRIIAGTLVDVGRGKYPPEYVTELIQKKDRTLAGKTCEPQGLYLLSVEYSG